MTINNDLPARTADTMSDAIALGSPSGRMSKRAKAAAQKRLGDALFGNYDPTKRAPETPAEKKERLINYAKFLRGLAAGGMKPRAYIREAKRLEAEAAVTA